MPRVNGAPLEEEDKVRIKQLLENRLEIKDKRKQLNAEMKDINEEAAKILEIEKAEVSLLFKDLENSDDSGEESMFGELYSLVEDIKS